MIAALVLVTVAVWSFYGAQFLATPLIDDEPYYFRQIVHFNQVIVLLLTGDFAAIPALWDEIVGNGWFIPAISLLLSPFYFVIQEPTEFRVLLFLVNAILHVYILYRILCLVGLRAMLVFHALSLLMPIYPVFMGAIVGEGLASRLALILLLRLYELSLREKPMGIRDAAGVGVLLVATVYLRQNLILLCPVVVAVQLLDHYRKCDALAWPDVRSAMAGAGTITVTFLILFLPWSYALSQKFGGPYLTTTSVQLVYIWKYATPEFERERLPANRHRNEFHAWMNYYTALAAKTGEPFHAIVARDKAALKPEVQPDAKNRYLEARLKRNFLKPNSFVERFYFGGVGKRGARARGAEASVAWRLSASMNEIVGFTILALGLLCLFLVPPPDADEFFLVLATKLFIAAMLAYFLWIGGHHRHLAALYPALMLLIAVAFGRGVRVASLAGDYGAADKTLLGIQLIIPVVLAAQALRVVT